MSEQHYQTDYSSHFPKVLHRPGREEKARKILAVLRDAVGPLEGLDALDVGCSSGGITAVLGGHFRSVVGVDIDAGALGLAEAEPHPANVAFRLVDGMALPFPDETFDVVLLNHVYEHVPSAERLLAEVHRVLRPRGISYFAAGNRLMLREGHYGLPLLSWPPKPVAHLYLRLARRGSHYYENHRTLWGLRRLVRDFDVTDYTSRILRDPEMFFCGDLLPPGSAVRRWAPRLARLAYPLLPTYIWVLRKTSPRGS